MFRIDSKKAGLLAAMLVFFFTAAAGTVTAQGNGQKDDAIKKALIGKWKSPEATIDIRSNGTITINGDVYAYRAKGAVIAVSNDQGSMLFPYELDGDTLVVELEGREIVYKRMKSDGIGPLERESPSSAGIVPEFVGKWCYLSSLTGTNSYMSSRCFTLYENGTYEYSGESASSGAYGSTAGQSYDSGRWTATRTTLTAHSSKNGTTVYPIELRNHPKTHDPMIVVDGDAYVTAYQRRSW